nr:thermonuclease family protein [Prochlorococcus marinus]
MMNKFRFNWKKAILVSFILIGYSSAINAKLPTTIIKNCYDGDTCTTIEGERIRLACIDTPEIKGKKADPIPAKEARDFLNNLLVNKKVSIKRITKDRYGRTVAELFKNGLNIQKMIIEKGHGKIYQKYSHQCKWAK